MKAGERGWLASLADRRPWKGTSTRSSPKKSFAAASQLRARAHVRAVMMDSGLRYGTPTQSAASKEASTSPEEHLLRGKLGALLRLRAQHLGLGQRAKDRRQDRLLVLFAALTGRMEDALGY